MRGDARRGFGPFGERVWLNCAHQGPLPRVAVDEAHEAISWRVTPRELTRDRFEEVPARLKRALGRLIGSPAEEVVLGNSASYGLHLLANGVAWRAGDEVLLVRGDFPADILPWQGLKGRGVQVRMMRPGRHLPDPEELEASLTSRTRLFCTTWVHSFSGHAADLEALGEVCRAHGIAFVVNAAQGLGARPIDISALAVDALVGVGFKWLCGPYGTGFCWMRPELLDSLEYSQAYWLALLSEDDLAREDLVLEDAAGSAGARRYDVFGTANFFNFKPWAAAVEYLLKRGIDRIAAHGQGLVSRFIEGLDPDSYDLLSPREGPARSTLVFVSHRDRRRNPEVRHRLAERGIDVAVRRGSLRLSPHLYNTDADVEGEVEFTTVMWFDSWEAVRAFAGDDHEVAYVPPAARKLLARFDGSSAHYEVRVSPQEGPEDFGI